MENKLKEKIQSVFEDASIDKNLYSSSGLNEQSIPVFVGEWLIDRELKGGDWDDDVKEKVLGFVSKYIPKKSDIELLKSKLKNGENVTILEFISPKVDLKKNETYVESSSLGNQKVFIEEQLLEQFPRLLQGGLWGAAVYNYQVADKGGEVWLQNFVPLQASQIDFEKYAKQRLEFSLEEWIAILINSIGLNPEGYTPEKTKQVLLTRLLPFVQKRINLFELAPKGTGKSFVFGNFSRYSRLVTGSISPAVLFYNENSKAPGLLTQFDAVVFDEAQSLSFSDPAVTVSNLKTYLESGKYAKGKFESTADSGAVFIANVQIDSNGLPVNSKNLFRELPQILQETAFIDRIHGIIQGWELPRIETSTLSNGIGFKADYIGEIFHTLRSRVEFDKFVEDRSYFIGTSDLRDKKAIMKMASGFLKLLFPNLTSVTDADFIKHCLEPAIALRQRVRDQLHYLDPEFKNYIIYVVNKNSSNENLEKVLIEESDEVITPPPKNDVSISTKVLEIKEGEIGYSYEILFSPFFVSSKEINLVDPFIRLSYQIDNFLAFCKLLSSFKITNLNLITSVGSDEEDDEQLKKNKAKFEEIKLVLLKKGIEFNFIFSEAIHDRYIETDNGWKITLGRGIDIFQRPESWYDLDRDDFTKRKCRATIISYNKI
jgi:ATP-dependent Lon protease